MSKLRKQNWANVNLDIRLAVSTIAYRLMAAMYAMSPYL